MEITLLDKNDCLKNIDDLFNNDLFNSIGAEARVTDFAFLTGTEVEDALVDLKYGNFFTKSLGTTTSMAYKKIQGVSAYNSNFNYLHVLNPLKEAGVRPLLISEDKKFEFEPFIAANIYCTYFGTYPQDVATNQDELEVKYQNGNLKKTEKHHMHVTTLDNGSILTTKYEEYTYLGKVYIRMIIDKDLINIFDELTEDYVVLSDGNEYKFGSPVWIKVEPIKWLKLDDKKLISEKILFSKRFNNNINYQGDFEATILYNYLNTSFKKEITDGFLAQEVTNNINETIPKKVKKINPYNFNFDKVSEEEIIKGALLSDIPVFLHGASGDGKSQRVKQFDEDATIIYLRNSSMESFNGKSVYNSETGEMIDIMPSWLKKVYEKCEKEPDKLHIVFFDEINNASNVIQGMAFNVVLNKEVNGIWKLPENARIVAAGNEMKDSLSAEELSEPLFNRFAHVYINTTTESWLKWASTPNENYERLDNTKVINEYKIHPSIYAYISYKSFMKKPVLRTKYNGVTPNADPRKWEMASKVLYATGKPDMLRSLVGKELTKDFMEFTKKEVITVEDVINYNVQDDVIKEMSIAEKYNLAVGLSVVNKENLEIVRDFVYNVGKEIGAIFDTLWTHGNEERLEYLLEIESKKQDNKKETSIKEVENLSFTFIDVDSEEIKNLYLFKRLDAEITDFALCTGGIYADIEGVNNGYYWTLTHKNLSSNYGPIDESTIVAVDSEGEEIAVYINKNAYSARPLLINASSYEAVNKFLGNHYITDDHKPVIEFGEYPQDAVSLGMQNKLKKLYKENKLELTENYYTIYDNKSYDKTSPNLEDLNKQITFEYIYNGKKYVRVNGNFADGGATLSNDNSYEDGEEIWIEVKPIEWYLYKNENGEYCLLSLKLLFSGVPFSTKKNYDGDFENTFIKEFMDEEFSKDILRGQYLTKENENVKALKK